MYGRVGGCCSYYQLVLKILLFSPVLLFHLDLAGYVPLEVRFL